MELRARSEEKRGWNERVGRVETMGGSWYFV